MRGRVRFLIFAMYLLLSTMIMFSCSKKASDVDDDADVDTTAPATISDLETVSVTTNTVFLQWTAPGDDGMTGFAYEYDLRASLDSITADNFPDAYRIDSIDAPLPAGYTQNFPFKIWVTFRKLFIV